LNKLGVGVVVLLLIATIYVGYHLYEQPKSVKIVISGATLGVELAETSADQQRGLSGRDSMATNHGMLFIFDHESYWSFWMNDMRFPLDIIWFDSNKRAVFIEDDLQACSSDQCPIFTPPVEAMYVLEVNAGFVSAHHISLGDTFSFV
jgi:uncharacterized membrane protein (UPF0127 family)